MKNEDQNETLHPWIAPELEARLTALVLGEASDFERDELERLIAGQPELGLYRKRLEAVNRMLHQVACGESEPAGEGQWKLSPEKRAVVIRQIGGGAVNAVGIRTAERKDPVASERRSMWALSLKIAACIAVVGLILFSAIPVYKSTDYSTKLAFQIAQSENEPMVESLRAAPFEAKPVPNVPLGETKGYIQYPGTGRTNATQENVSEIDRMAPSLAESSPSNALAYNNSGQGGRKEVEEAKPQPFGFSNSGETRKAPAEPELRLGDANTYTGATTINAGTLVTSTTGSSVSEANKSLAENSSSAVTPAPVPAAPSAAAPTGPAKEEQLVSERSSMTRADGFSDRLDRDGDGGKLARSKEAGTSSEFKTVDTIAPLPAGGMKGDKGTDQNFRFGTTTAAPAQPMADATGSVAQMIDDPAARPLERSAGETAGDLSKNMGDVDLTLSGKVVEFDGFVATRDQEARGRETALTKSGAGTMTIHGSTNGFTGDASSIAASPAEPQLPMAGKKEASGVSKDKQVKLDASGEAAEDKPVAMVGGDLNGRSSTTASPAKSDGRERDEVNRSLALGSGGVVAANTLTLNNGSLNISGGGVISGTGTLSPGARREGEMGQAPLVESPVAGKPASSVKGIVALTPQINITGNSKTKDHVIRRELPLEKAGSTTFTGTVNFGASVSRIDDVTGFVEVTNTSSLDSTTESRLRRMDYFGDSASEADKSVQDILALTPQVGLGIEDEEALNQLYSVVPRIVGGGSESGTRISDAPTSEAMPVVGLAFGGGFAEPAQSGLPGLQRSAGIATDPNFGYVKQQLQELRKNLPAGLEELSAADESFSTFSLHVSDVSFKLAQASLAKGEWPEAEKIRIEEFVNAFDYGDPMPGLNDRVACRVDQAIHPFLQQRNLLRIAMRTAAAGRSAETPLCLTILLDNSGSMERPDRSETVQRAFATLAGQLKPTDQITLISFARQPRLVADAFTGEQAGQLVELVSQLPSEGGTNLEAALKLAFEKAQEHRSENSQNRIVLLTDGAANLGDAKAESLSTLIESMRDSGIAFDAAGVGAEGLNDEILEALTRKGDGRYYLLDQPGDAEDGFAKQIAGALRPAAKNVKVQVEFNPKRVGAYQLLGFEKHRLETEDFRNDKVDAAEMAAAEAGVAVYQVEPKADGEGDIGSVSVRFRDLDSDQMVEKRWPIPYLTGALRPDQAGGAIQIATVASQFAAKLKGGPLGDVVDLGELANLAASLPDGPRVAELRTMIEQARAMEGAK